MHKLTNLIKEDMKPALGVTEPGAIAFVLATAKENLQAEVEKVYLRLNSGMFKNAFTCGIPNSSEFGNYYAAALGVVAGDASKGLECLDKVSSEAEIKAKAMVEAGKIQIDLSEITSRIFIEAKVVSGTSEVVVTVRDSHTNIVEIRKDGVVIFEKETDKTEAEQGKHMIHEYSLKELCEYAKTVDIKELEFIKEAYDVNLELFEEGLTSTKTSFARYLLAENGGKIISRDEQKTANLLCNATIEARVLGLSKPAMSITGSGAHGIIATMPLYAAYKVNDYTEETLLRGTALSYLVCMYIKEYSGKLSAFCGCAIAAGTGTGCGLIAMAGGDEEVMTRFINNVASSITGMICDGGNQGCTMKGVVAVDTIYTAMKMAFAGVSIADIHGINGATPETTMKNMGLIASPGMEGTEKTIIDILETKKI